MGTSPDRPGGGAENASSQTFEKELRSRTQGLLRFRLNGNMLHAIPSVHSTLVTYLGKIDRKNGVYRSTELNRLMEAMRIVVAAQIEFGASSDTRILLCDASAMNILNGGIPAIEFDKIIGRVVESVDELTMESVDIMRLQERPRQKELFLQLAINKKTDSDFRDMPTALGGKKSEEISEDPDSFEIAQFLYQAVQKNKDLRELFISLVPEGLATKAQREESVAYYGLVEIAFRLAELIEMSQSQGGVIQQKTYDDKIMIPLICGQLHTKHKELQPLYDLLQAKGVTQFRSFYLVPKEA